MTTIKLEPKLLASHRDFAVGSFSAALFLIGRSHPLLAITLRNGKPAFYFRADAAPDASLFEREKQHLAAEVDRTMSALNARRVTD